MSDAPIRVLFVCTGNSARSQIAEAVLGRLGGPDFEVFSAGTEPKGVNPYTVRVLADAGHRLVARVAASRSTSSLGQPFDYVITVCDRARQTCPVFPGSHNSLHWGLEDPAEVEGSDAERRGARSSAPTSNSTSGIRPVRRGRPARGRSWSARVDRWLRPATRQNGRNGPCGPHELV